MDIATVSSGHIPSKWAHSLAPAKNSHGFQQLGHDVELLTVERLTERLNKRNIKDVHDHYDIDNSIDIRYFRDNPLFYIQEQKPLGYLPGALRRLTGNRIRYVWDPERRISDYCLDCDVDICYCRTYRTVYYNIGNGVPTVMESHTQSTTHPDLQRVIEMTDKDAFKGLITISKQLQANFVDAGVPSEKVEVILPGVDLTQFQNVGEKRALRRELDLPVDTDIAMYTGSLRDIYGIDHILHAAAELPEVVFVLVGGSDEKRERWRDTASKHGIENVQFVEFVPNSEIPRYLTAADVLLAPYVDDGDTDLDLDYTTPSKLFEYMAAERPVVATDVSPHARLIDHEHSGLLAARGDPEAFTEQIRRALTDDILARQLSTGAATDIREHQWSRRCQRILDEFC
jgi:glycosyltransferase involved in cell wall biosynthesis